MFLNKIINEFMLEIIYNFLNIIILRKLEINFFIFNFIMNFYFSD